MIGVRGWLVVLLLLPATGCPECEDDCSDVFSILFRKATVWPAGTYDVDVELDGDSVHYEDTPDWQRLCGPPCQEGTIDLEIP